MNELLNYKGFTGSVEFSKADNVFFGEILGIQGLVLYEGDTIDQLIHGFHDMVDGYIDFCERHNHPLPAHDTANLSVKLELYRELEESAQKKNMPVQAFIEQTLWHSIDQLKAS